MIDQIKTASVEQLEFLATIIAEDKDCEYASGENLKVLRLEWWKRKKELSDGQVSSVD